MYPKQEIAIFWENNIFLQKRSFSVFMATPLIYTYLQLLQKNGKVVKVENLKVDKCLGIGHLGLPFLATKMTKTIFDGLLVFSFSQPKSQSQFFQPYT